MKKKIETAEHLRATSKKKKQEIKIKKKNTKNYIQQQNYIGTKSSFNEEGLLRLLAHSTPTPIPSKKKNTLDNQW